MLKWRKGRRRAAWTVTLLAMEHQLGSAMAVTPLIAALRACLPDGRVSVVCGPIGAEVMSRNPQVDSVILLPDVARHPWLFLARGVLLALSLRARRGTSAWLLGTPPSARRSVTLVARCLPAKQRLGFWERAAGVDGMGRYDPEKSMIGNILGLGEPLGASVVDREPEAFFSPEALARVEAALRNQGWSSGQPLAVFVAQTSGGQPTAWEPDRIGVVAGEMARRWGMLPVFVGTAEGEDLVAGIRFGLEGPSLSLLGETNVEELAALCARSDFVVSLDTGAMHVARGVGVPMVVIASAWQAPHHWLPPADVPWIRVLRTSPSCANCGLTVCATMICMDAVTPTDVLAAVADLLVHYPSCPSRSRGQIARRMVTGAGRGEASLDDRNQA